MKRFHIHLSVNDLDKHVTFYNKLFATSATTVKADYAKWELDDPAINFAISTKSETLGLNHLGFQVDNNEMLDVLKAQADVATGTQTGEAETTACCYANSKKHWTVDPSGIAWEQYFTMGQTEYYSGDSPQSQSGCC